MAYEIPSFPLWILRNPIKAAVIPVAAGFGGGLVLEISIWPGAFGPFGSVTVALSVLFFGMLAGELLTRSQGTFIMKDDDEPGASFTFDQVRKALNLETVVVTLGTLQWGFGHLLSEWLQ